MGKNIYCYKLNYYLQIIGHEKIHRHKDGHNVWCFDDGVARASQKIIPLIIGKKENNVRPVIGKGLGRFIISPEGTVTENNNKSQINKKLHDLY